MRNVSVIILSMLAVAGHANLTPFKPTPEELKSLYQQADRIGNAESAQVLNSNLTFTWLDNSSFYYRRDTTPGNWRFTRYDVKTKAKTDLFDHEKLSTAFNEKANQKTTADRLNISITRIANNVITFTANRKTYTWDTKTNTLTETTRPEPTPAQQNQGQLSPDRQTRARLNDGKLQIRANQPDAEWMDAGDATELARISWSPDSKFIAVQSQIPGDRRQVSVLDSSKDGTRAELRTRLYDQPGDKLDTSETYIYNLATRRQVKVPHDPIICGGHPWASPPGLRWWTPKGQSNPTALIEFDIRGFQEKRVIEIDPNTGKVTQWINEKSPTFIHLSEFFWQPMPTSRGLVWRSERDGWAHLYHYKSPTEVVQITKGNFVVRSIENLTEKEIIFSANGRESGDPYFMHYYKINIDGSGLTHLTSQPGFHQATFSPDFQYFVDRSSTVKNAPTYTLRNGKGESLGIIEQSSAEPLRKAGIQGPIEFVAKGRDGQTDIYGVIHFPTHLDPNKTYPIVEDIYAGPHDSFVPKTFRTVFYQQRLAELGFIVVQMDGMGTANRGKKFHDVAWKNVADAGLPDRIAWIKAAAEKYPQMDTTRVGIYGTSAGGQNSTGALLFHPEFYKVAVSSCGCHDNRMDKYWWNEQWMGYPVGPHYEEQSNITNAPKLQGNLLLMVGEVDSNVPPESTFKLVDALIKAKKDFEFVYLPGLDHTAGGEFGERKRRDFFVKHLLNVDPPNWN